MRDTSSHWLVYLWRLAREAVNRQSEYAVGIIGIFTLLLLAVWSGTAGESEWHKRLRSDSINMSNQGAIAFTSCYDGRPMTIYLKEVPRDGVSFAEIEEHEAIHRRQSADNECKDSLGFDGAVDLMRLLHYEVEAYCKGSLKAVMRLEPTVDPKIVAAQYVGFLIHRYGMGQLFGNPVVYQAWKDGCPEMIPNWEAVP